MSAKRARYWIHKMRSGVTMDMVPVRIFGLVILFALFKSTSVMAWDAAICKGTTDTRRAAVVSIIPNVKAYLKENGGPLEDIFYNSDLNIPDVLVGSLIINDPESKSFIVMCRLNGGSTFNSCEANLYTKEVVCEKSSI